MKKRNKLIMIITAGCLLVLAACYTVFLAPLLEEEEWIYKEAVVERGTLKVGVTESGQLEYGVSSVLYDLDLDVSSEEDDDDEEEEEAVSKYLKIEEVYVAAGQRIEEGDLLIKFTEDSVSDVRQLLNSALVDAQSEYAEAQSEYRLSVLEAETDYETQKLEASYATSTYLNSSQSVTNQIAIIQTEIDQRNANVATLQEKVDEAWEDYNEIADTYEDAKQTMSITGTDHTKNFLTIQNEYLRVQSQYEAAKSALKQAQDNLQNNEKEILSLQEQLKLEQAKLTIETLEAEQSYQESVIGGENAEITYNAQLESLKETLDEAEEEKTKLEEQLREFEAFVGDDGCLYAKEAGIVTQVAYEAGDRLKETGAVISYAAPEEMTISVDVTQEDIVDLQVGDEVDITFTAYEDTPYEGVIESIETTNTSANSNTVSYTVVIHVLGDTDLLYGGMTADIIFVTEEKEVEVGISNGVDVEILSGLEEGETIYLASRVSSEEEVKSSAEASEDTESSLSGESEMQGGFEVPEGFEMPEGMQMPGGGDSSGGQMPGGNNAGGQMPGGMSGGPGM